MGRTLGWWLTIGVVLGLFFAFVAAWVMNRPYDTWLLYGVGGGAIVGLLLYGSSR